jgi:hypothetical protein
MQIEPRKFLLASAWRICQALRRVMTWHHHRLYIQVVMTSGELSKKL